MKVSIVLPVYNGQETIKECLKSIKDLEYFKLNYEVVIVNDGSTDETKKIVEDYIPTLKKSGIQVELINSKTNRGRIEARMTGAQKASYENLLFIDHRCIANSSILKSIEKKNYNPIIGNLYQRPEDNLISRFFYVFRSILYRPYFGKRYQEILINKHNFSKIAKGFSPFFCDKALFFKSLPEDRSKWVNDDTLIFANIIEKREILKTSDVVCTYKERATFKEFLWHLYHRGPRFVDFYWNVKSRYFSLIVALLLFPILCVGIIMLLKVFSIAFALGILLLIAGILLIQGFSLKDVNSVFVIGPFVFVSFGLGVYAGVFRKLFLKKS